MPIVNKILKTPVNQASFAVMDLETTGVKGKNSGDTTLNSKKRIPNLGNRHQFGKRCIKNISIKKSLTILL